ncbi:hypothetical protein [Pseudonocardia acaciae]|uniref:hypothetical protein n=1 Tax=Pseudonocardia acaciae TaxID=551276 RepID=UPI0012ED7C4B|nr:hypothetical protein [Pseudonocardia acaciae]
MANGGQAIYKPVDGEHPAFAERHLFPRGALALGEVTAWRLDRLFGFALVPPTIWWDGPRGIGSLQRFVPAAAGLATSRYPLADRERMAILDYLIANTDRGRHNYLTAPDGRPVAIDNGNSFPRSPHALYSDFVQDRVGQPLSAPVLDQVRAVDPEALVRMLGTAGQPSELTTGAVRRLLVIQHAAMITTEEWDAGLLPHAETRVAKMPGRVVS